MTERKYPVPPELECLSAFIDSHTECVAGSSSELRSIALRATKHIFDWALGTEKSSKPHLETLLATLTEAAPPQTRSQARRSASLLQKPKKRADTGETPLPFLFVEGMNIDQIWQQLDLRATRICENLRVLQGEDEDADLEGEDDENEEGDEDEDENEVEDTEMDIDDENFREDLSASGEDDSPADEGIVGLQEEMSEDDDKDYGPPASMLDVVRSQPKRKRSHPQGNSDLDDGFFDLAAFNAETDEVEAREVSKGKLNRDADDDSTEESEIDLFGSVDDPGTEDVDDGPELFYDDFFEPPSPSQTYSVRSSKVRFHGRVSVKMIKAVGKGMPVSSMDDDDSVEEEDVEE